MNNFQRFKARARSPIKVFWWRYEYPTKLNFGDELTPYLIRNLWGRRCEWAPPQNCELVGAGSVIEMLQRKSKGNHIKIWGSGFMKPGDVNSCDNLEFFAVRGKQSLSRVESTHNVALGDPGLLSSLVFKPSKKVTHKVGVIPHYVDEDSPLLDKYRSQNHIKLINPLDTPVKVISDITSCELILSSSLHGLIVADSFGVPNYWTPLSDKVSGGAYKFEDYYSATNRQLLKEEVSVLDDNMRVEAAIDRYQHCTNLNELQQGLMKSFPF